MRLTVVKLGGSFARWPRLRELMGELEPAGGHAVIVPGGGPFADCVRREQERFGYDDRTAHRMALIAMASFGTALASLSGRLASAGNPKELRAALRSGRVPVWLPLDIVAGRPDIPETWEVTSDSLAVWLAGQLGAERLVFLKRRTGRSGAADLARRGILDPSVPAFLARHPVEAWLCGPRDIAGLGAAIAAGATVGRRIAPA